MSPLSTRLAQAEVVAAPDMPRISATLFTWRDPAAIPPRPWLLGKRLLLGTVAAVIAPGGVGKSTLTATMALSLVSRRALLGWNVHGDPRAVWLWNLEDDGDELARQLQAAALFHRVAPEEVAGRLYVDSALDGAGLCTAEQGPDGFRLIRPVTEALQAELIRRDIGCLIVDPFVSSHAAPENDNNAVDAVAKEWARVARAAGCCIVLVHHARKPNGERVTADLARGASALVNAARTVLVLNRMDAAEAERFGITDPAERRSLFTVDADKTNRAPPESADWFKLHGQMLGNGGPFEGGDSVAVVTPWTPPDLFEGVTAGDLRRVQEAVATAEEGERRKSDQSPGWVGHVIGTALGRDPDDKAERSKIKRMLAEWTRNGAFVVRAMVDAKGNARPFIEVGELAPPAASPPRNPVVGKGGEGGGPAHSHTHPHHHLPPLGGWGGVVVVGSAEQGGGGGGEITPPDDPDENLWDSDREDDP